MVTPILGMLRYKKNITQKKLQSLTPRRLSAYVMKLKETINRKNAIIKRIRVKETRQEKKINSLKALRIGLNIISTNPEQILQVL